MIFGFVGTPGSGKTYEAILKILTNLKMGRVVFSNIRGLSDPICREHIKVHCGLSDLAIHLQLNHIEDAHIPEFWDHVSPGSLIVIDEAQNFFNAREWQTRKNAIFSSWSSTHRHFGFDLILITQDIARIDSAVRSLLEWCYVFRKVNFFGGAVTRKYLCYAYCGEDTHGTALKKDTRTYLSYVFPCYKSYVAADVKEIGVMKHVNILKHPVFFAIPIVLAATIYMIFFKSSLATGDPFGSKKVMAQAESTLKNMDSSKTKTSASSGPSGSAPATTDPKEKNERTIKKTVVNGQAVYSFTR